MLARHYRMLRYLCPSLFLFCAFTAPAVASDSITRLFADEMRQVTTNLKWRGERLTDDTVYAAAVTGLSWQPAWGKQHLFSLAWGDLKKTARSEKRPPLKESQVQQLVNLYQARDYPGVTAMASTHFSSTEISGEIRLKEAVGGSYLALMQPHRAFPVFASPFDPERRKDVSTENGAFRMAAFTAAQRAGLTKEAIAFGLSLLLEPADRENPLIQDSIFRYLTGAGVEIERVALGILQAPSGLHGLPFYTYAAADLLALRALPRHLPYLTHLSDTDDTYLRARALIGLGIVAYQTHPLGPVGWEGKLLYTSYLARPFRQYGLSSGERGLIMKELKEAASSDRYRLRAAAAVAAGLMGSDDVHGALFFRFGKRRRRLWCVTASRFQPAGGTLRGANWIRRNAGGRMSPTIRAA
jgi:hypothetical protein